LTNSSFTAKNINYWDKDPRNLGPWRAANVDETVQFEKTGDIARVSLNRLSRLAPRLEGMLSAVEINPLAVLPHGRGAVALDLLAIAGGGCHAGQ
jgi:hypothetical protein